MIDFYKAAEVFQQHADEILCVLSETQENELVIAEVSLGGQWRGASRAQEGTYSWEGYLGHCYAIHIYPEIGKTRESIDKAIRAWVDAWRQEEVLDNMTEGEEEEEEEENGREEEKIIGSLKAQAVFAQHADEISRVLSKTPEGQLVIAEVDGFGNWLGVRVAELGTSSKIASEGKGHAIHFYPEDEQTYFDVLRAIDEWLEGEREELCIEYDHWDC